MLPSPSLGPPWLSLSLSPAFAPWGIPEELELVDVAAGAEELDDLEEEPPPQPATASAAATSATPNHRRAVSKLSVISVPFLLILTTSALDFFPRAVREDRVQSATPSPQPPSMMIS
jgi:hypothetical protein